jgi:polyhydroxyalkanoate synthesis repressor PhaR
MKSQKNQKEEILIKRYSNRRLYNCSISKYINLKDLIKVISDNQLFKVEDHISGEDLTQQTLIQLIYEVNNPKNAIFSAEFIKKLFSISSKYNNSDISKYLETCLNKFQNYENDSPKDLKNIDLLDLQIQILELKKLIIDYKN